MKFNFSYIIFFQIIFQEGEDAENTDPEEGNENNEESEDDSETEENEAEQEEKPKAQRPAPVKVGFFYCK